MNTMHGAFSCEEEEEEEEEQEQEQEEEVALMKVRPLPQCDASLERFEVQVSLD